MKQFLGTEAEGNERNERMNDIATLETNLTKIRNDINRLKGNLKPLQEAEHRLYWRIRELKHIQALVPCIGKEVRYDRAAEKEFKRGVLIELRRTRALVDFGQPKRWLVPIEDLEPMDSKTMFVALNGA